MSDLRIIGAGLAGLIAGHAFPKAEIIEAAAAPAEAHKALLRFRSDDVAKLTGIPFRKVQVRKSIFFDGQHRQPDLRLANFYSQKLFGSGIVGPERSIWAIEPCERYVAPSDFYAQLVAQLCGRIRWGATAKDERAFGNGAISTIPLPSLLAMLEVELPHIEFKSSPINVARFRIPGADAFQTVYYPQPDFPVYRASLTGDLLIVEGVGEVGIAASIVAAQAFGLTLERAEMLESTTQRYGKILPIPNDIRKGLLFNLTHKFGIYSLGRFATWRNILLDDVVKDCKVIASLRASESAYDWRRHAS